MTQADSAFVGSIPELYDLCLGPMLFEPYALDLGRRFEGFKGALLETAAGTGRATRALARAVTSSATITATDLSAPMLARAAQVVTAPNVVWREADALALPFADASFDAVACQFGVMFFPDKIAGFTEARRVLKPGGRLVFSVWDRIEDNDVPLLVRDTVTAQFPDDPPGFFARGPFSWHDKAQIHAALGEAGFGAVEIDTVRLPTPARSAIDAAIGLCSGSPMGGEIEARRPGGLDATVQAVAQALIKKFGDGPFDGQGQALVVTAKV
ncbi:class I SAM-dependent methyltransferase [soil metagenome]